jgi:hypothetical protein
MNTTAPPTHQPHATAVDEFEEIAPVVAAPPVYGPPVLLLFVPWLLLVLLIIPPAALLLTVVGVVLLPFVAVALGIGIVAAPYLLVRATHRRFAERRESREASVPVTHHFAQAGWSTGPAGAALPATHVPWIGD